MSTRAAPRSLGQAGAVVETATELIAVLPTLERALQLATPLEGAIDRFGRLVDRLPGGRRADAAGPSGPAPRPDPGAPRGPAAAPNPEAPGGRATMADSEARKRPRAGWGDHPPAVRWPRPPAA